MQYTLSSFLNFYLKERVIYNVNGDNLKLCMISHRNYELKIYLKTGLARIMTQYFIIVPNVKASIINKQIYYQWDTIEYVSHRKKKKKKI